MHLSMLSPREGGPGKGWGFDFLNQIPPPRTISSESAYVFMDHLGPRLRSNSREWGSQEHICPAPPPSGLTLIGALYVQVLVKVDTQYTVTQNMAVFI